MFWNKFISLFGLSKEMQKLQQEITDLKLKVLNMEKERDTLQKQLKDTSILNAVELTRLNTEIKKYQNIINQKELVITQLNKQIQSINNELENKWNSKKPKVDVVYSGRPLPGTNVNFEMDVRNYFDTYDSVIRNLALPFSNLKDDDTKALGVLNWVRNHIIYVSDTSLGGNEYWKFACETLAQKRGDCVAEYEEIYTQTGLKKAKDIQIGDMVLSYDFVKKKFTYNPILNVWDKGIKKIFRVHFRNGQHIDVTDEHNFLVRENQKESKYIKQELKSIDLTRWWKRKIPIALKIPYEIKDIEWLNEDLCFVLGHFLADGWNSQKVGSSGYELEEYIIPLLEKNNIPFSEGKNGNGVPQINFLKSEFKDFLRKQKNNSFDIHLQEEILCLPENKLKSIVSGFWLGDGHNGNYSDKRGFKSNKSECYSTISKQWAKDIQRIGLQTGKSFHIWKQNNHQGKGKEPIYRITYNPASHFLKDYGYNDISEVSISFIEEIGEFQTFDWEVKDTHNFIFKNGIITHNCEDGSILMANLLLMAGIPYWKLRLNAGDINGGGHCYVTYFSEIFKDWYILDWCYWPEESINDFGKKSFNQRNDKYWGIWFSWNLKYCFNETIYTDAVSHKINNKIFDNIKILISKKVVK